jgi:hypothetical protein
MRCIFISCELPCQGAGGIRHFGVDSMFCNLNLLLSISDFIGS